MIFLITQMHPICQPRHLPPSPHKPRGGDAGRQARVMKDTELEKL